MKGNSESPTLFFFRATPLNLLEQPPLASSLQTFETCLFLIGLKRFPSALISCATAWESAIKAKLSIPPEDRVSLEQLLDTIIEVHSRLNGYDTTTLDDFRRTRNRLIHYGFSPKDDEKCAALLLKTGLPFLKDCYHEFFDFYLDWRDISPSIDKFINLNPGELERLGLFLRSLNSFDMQLKPTDVQDKHVARDLPTVSGHLFSSSGYGLRN